MARMQEKFEFLLPTVSPSSSSCWIASWSTAMAVSMAVPRQQSVDFSGGVTSSAISSSLFCSCEKFGIHTSESSETQFDLNDLMFIFVSDGLSTQIKTW